MSWFCPSGFCDPYRLCEVLCVQVLRRPHFLLVTLVLCNAAATEVCQLSNHVKSPFMSSLAWTSENTMQRHLGGAGTYSGGMHDLKLET